MRCSTRFECEVELISKDGDWITCRYVESGEITEISKHELRHKDGLTAILDMIDQLPEVKQTGGHDESDTREDSDRGRRDGNGFHNRDDESDS